MFSVTDFQTVYSKSLFTLLIFIYYYKNLVIGQLGIDKELSAGKWCVS